MIHSDFSTDMPHLVDDLFKDLVLKCLLNGQTLSHWDFSAFGEWGPYILRGCVHVFRCQQWPHL